MLTMQHYMFAFLFLASAAQAQIPGLCNTGQTRKLPVLCTGTLVTPNPSGGGPNTDGNWKFAYVTKGNAAEAANPCINNVAAAYVDTPNAGWLPNGDGLSEWITPYNGENNQPAGGYIYVTYFPVSDSPAPTGFLINGQLASDNATVDIYLATPAGSSNCLPIAGQTFPVNPSGPDRSDYQQWWQFSFSNSGPIAVASPAALYFVVRNLYDKNGPSGESPTGLRVEFFSSSTFTY